MGATPSPTLFAPALPGVKVVPVGGSPVTAGLIAGTAGVSRNVDVEALLRIVPVWLLAVAVDAFRGRDGTGSVGAINRAGIGALDATDLRLAIDATDDTEGERIRLAAEAVAAVIGEPLVGSDTLGLVTAMTGFAGAFASLLVAVPVFCAFIAAARPRTDPTAEEPATARVAGIGFDLGAAVGLSDEEADACDAVDASRFLGVVAVDAVDSTEAFEAVKTSRDLTEAVEAGGDFGRAEAGFLVVVGKVGKGGASTGAAVGRVDGGPAGVDGLILRLLFIDGVGDTSLVGLGPARTGVLPLSIVLFTLFVGEGSFDGDLGTGAVEVGVGVLVEIVVLVVRTDRTDAAEDAFCGGVWSCLTDVRAINWRGGPLICLVWRDDDGVGLDVSLVRRDTLLPFSAAVGLRALAVPGKGAVAGTGPDTDLVDLVLLTEAVDAELLSLNRRSPGASTRAAVLGPAVGGGSSGARNVEAWDEALDSLEDEADDLTLPASESDMTRDVVRGRPGGGATPRRFRMTGEMAEGPSRSSIDTSISGRLASG